MAARSPWRGYVIELGSKGWAYLDTGELTVGSKRPCGLCHKPPTVEGHDACLGTLAGVVNACCGHGVEGMVYVQLEDGPILRGQAARKFIRDTKL